MLEKGNDLCADTATLNYKSLVTTAEIAVSLILQEIERYKKELDTAYRNKDTTLIEMSAKRMRDKTIWLIDATEVLAVLYGSADRDILQINGRPKK
jgi:hypothetical protein